MRHEKSCLSLLDNVFTVKSGTDRRHDLQIPSPKGSVLLRRGFLKEHVNDSHHKSDAQAFVDKASPDLGAEVTLGFFVFSSGSRGILCFLSAWEEDACLAFALAFAPTPAFFRARERNSEKGRGRGKGTGTLWRPTFFFLPRKKRERSSATSASRSSTFKSRALTLGVSFSDNLVFTVNSRSMA